LVGITPERAKIERSNTVKLTNGDGEMMETTRPTTARTLSQIN